MKIRFGLLFIMSILLISAYTQKLNIDLLLQPGELEISPSFEACSYYFNPKGVHEKEYVVEFRKKGSQQWQPTFKTVSDLPAGVWKGSIFGLEEDTDWQLRVRSCQDSNHIIFQEEFRTWSRNPPIARVVDLSKFNEKRGEGIVISDVGKPDGWIKYTAPPGWVLKREYKDNDPHSAAVSFNKAEYVILENVTIEGGYNHGIVVDESKYVRIINCDISGWGRRGVQVFTNIDPSGRKSIGKYLDSKGKIVNGDAGVYIKHSLGTVVERCYIHDPRIRANSWMFSHPTGPCAVFVNNTQGGNVIRYNDMIGSDEHRWNDVIQSYNNGSAEGGFYRDSDIYGNFLAFGNDDGVELEGGGMNIRFYRNKIEGTLCGVSTGACILGPQFVFGNLLTNLGDESGLSLVFFKNGHGNPQGGKRYFVNNTLYGFDTRPISGYGKPLPNRQIGFMRNNIFSCANTSSPEWAKLDDFDNDLFWVENNPHSSRKLLSAYKEVGQEKNGMAGDPQLVAPVEGNYQLSLNSIAVKKAITVANICPAGEDLGAFINGITELPYRPLALSVLPQQLNFLSLDEKSTREVTLTLPISENKAIKFEVRQNKVANWFKVTPSSGEIKPGESCKLLVTIDKDNLIGRQMFRGAFIIRTPEGLSRPVSVYAKGEFTEDLRPSAAPNTVYIEVAELPGMKKFTRTTSKPAVSKGKYVELKGSSKEPAMSAEINITEAGSYSLLLRLAIKDDVSPRKFHLTLDKEEKDVSFNPYFRWNQVDENYRVVFLQSLGELTVGKHQIKLKDIKGKINLNQLIITDNPGVFFEQYWQREKK